MIKSNRPGFFVTINIWLVFVFLTGCSGFHKLPQSFTRKSQKIAVVSLLGQGVLNAQIEDWPVQSHRFAALNWELEKYCAKKIVKKLESWPQFDFMPMQKVISNPRYQKIPDDTRTSPFKRSYSRGLKKFHQINPFRAQDLYQALGVSLFLIMKPQITLHIKKEKSREYGWTELRLAIICYDKDGQLAWQDTVKSKATQRFLIEGSLDFNITKIQSNLDPVLTRCAQKLKQHFHKE